MGFYNFLEVLGVFEVKEDVEFMAGVLRVCVVFLIILHLKPFH
jgi:hypothetical protein